MGHARAIINIENPDLQLVIFKRILSDDLSVRQVEEMTRKLSHPKGKTPSTSPTGSSREINQLQGRLSSHFGTKVTVKSDGKKGEIKIPFLSIQDLNRILDLLKM